MGWPLCRAPKRGGLSVAYMAGAGPSNGVHMEKFDYGSRRWARLSERAKRRDNYQCVRCRRYGRLRPAK